MSQFVQTNGDYTIKTAEGGTIKFDTGDSLGKVRVTGDLIVEGDTLTVSAENLDVIDNIINLNAGETGAGVTLRYSGIQVDRGSLPAASVLYDDNDDVWNFINGSPEGIISWSDSKIRVKEILTDSDTDSGDLLLIGSGSGVVKVFGTTSYELNVTHDDDIPNKKYVDDAIQLSPTYQIKSPETGAFAGGYSGDSRVIIADKHVQPNTPEQPGSLNAFTAQTGYTTFAESAISVLVDGILNTQFYNNRAVIQGLEILGNEITNNDTNGSVFIRTFGTGRLQTNYALELEQIAGTPARIPNSSQIYAADPSLGDSGVFFVNDSTNAYNQRGELISKNRARLFSMIF